MAEEEVAEERAVAGSAIREEDLVYATLALHRRRVDEALNAIRKAVEIGPVGVSFSGGKDSTCLLALVREVVPDAPVGFFDSGCELDSTMDMVRASGADVIAPRMTMFDMARYAGWWGYEHPVDKGVAFDAKRVVIQEPSEAFVVRRRLRVLAYGLRAEESGNRKRHANVNGELFLGADRTWYCQPMIRWTLSDVWAFIASRGLMYNAGYDAMAEAGIERVDQRIATLLGDRGAGFGRHAFLRRFAPDRWARIVSEFPGLARES